MAGINDNLDKEQRDVLNQDPLPTLYTTYATICCEFVRLGIMGATSSLGMNPSEIGKGLVTKHRSKTSFRHDDWDRSHLKCSYCGGARHNRKGALNAMGAPNGWKNTSKGRPLPRSRYHGLAARLTLLRPS